MARAATVMTETDLDDGDTFAGGGANSLAGLGDAAPGTDSRPSPRQRDSAPEPIEIIEIDEDRGAGRGADDGRDDGRDSRRDSGRDARDGDGRRDSRLNEDYQGDGTLLDQRRAAQDRTEAARRERESPTERRRRQREGRDRTIQENEFLRAKIQELEHRVGGIEPRLSDYDQAQRAQQAAELERQMHHHQSLVSAAEERLSEALVAQDGTSVTKALRERDQAVMAANQAQVRRNMLLTGDPMGDPRDGQKPLPRRQEQDRQAAPAQTPLPPAAQSRVNEFVRENPWFRVDAQGRPMNEETAVAMVIDQQVASQFDPAGDAYWDELDRRLERRLPEVFEDRGAPARDDRRQVNGRAVDRRDDGRYDDRGDGRQQDRRMQSPQRRGPAVGGGADSAPPNNNSNRVYLTPARKQAMIDAGILARDGRSVEDRTKFDRLLKSYQQFDRENGIGA